MFYSKLISAIIILHLMKCFNKVYLYWCSTKLARCVSCSCRISRINISWTTLECHHHRPGTAHNKRYFNFYTLPKHTHTQHQEDYYFMILNILSKCMLWYFVPEFCRSALKHVERVYFLVQIGVSTLLQVMFLFAGDSFKFVYTFLNRRT